MISVKLHLLEKQQGVTQAKLATGTQLQKFTWFPDYKHVSIILHLPQKHAHAHPTRTSCRGAHHILLQAGMHRARQLIHSSLPETHGISVCAAVLGMVFDLNLHSPRKRPVSMAHTVQKRRHADSAELNVAITICRSDRIPDLHAPAEHRNKKSGNVASSSSSGV